MNFTSDNWAGVHPAITENLARHASGMAAAYGHGDLDQQVERRFCEIFEREVAVFFVGTGTAANSLALASVNRPGDLVGQIAENEVIARLVTRFATTTAEVAEFTEMLGRPCQ